MSLSRKVGESILPSSDILYPSIPVGHLSDEQLQNLIREDHVERHGELRMRLRSDPLFGTKVQVYAMYEQHLQWFDLVTAAQRPALFEHLRHGRYLYHSVGDLLRIQHVDRSTLRWYPYAFEGAAYSIGELVILRIGDWSCQATVQRDSLFHDPGNDFGITTYDLDMHLAPGDTEKTRFAMEDELERVPLSL